MSEWKMTRRWLVIGALFAAIAGTATVLILAQDDEAPRCSEVKFDEKVWRNVDRDREDDEIAAKGKTSRQTLADGLVRCDLLVGRTRGDVRRMLGRPDERDRLGEYYYVGPERGPIKVDAEVLAVMYADDVVRQTEVVVP